MAQEGRINWAKHATDVVEEIALQDEMTLSGWIPKDPKREDRLQRDLAHCTFMAKLHSRPRPTRRASRNVW